MGDAAALTVRALKELSANGNGGEPPGMNGLRLRPMKY
jgi:hypothetical protein